MSVAEILANPDTVVLVDMSSILYPIWHTTQADPDPNKTSQQTVSRIHALATGFDRVAVCCDSGRTFRRDIEATYKANRAPKEAALMHQLSLAEEQLRADGFTVWSAAGFEADDIIASAVHAVSGWPAPVPVLIVTGDKDLLQLLGPLVFAKSVRDGSVMDAQAFTAKYGIQPGQMRDYLTLCGDTSDNIVGAAGIGPVNAGKLLAKYGSLDQVFSELDAVGAAAMGLSLKLGDSLRAFKAGAFETTRRLVTLRSDVPLQLDDLLKERREAVQAEAFEMLPEEEETQLEPAEAEAPAVFDAAVVAPAPPAQVASHPPASQKPPSLESGDEVLGAAKVMLRKAEAPGPSVAMVAVDYERALDPRSMRDAQVLALNMHKSRMFSAYGSPEAVLSTVMLGRELGLPAMASLRGIHNIEGRHALSAQLMVALVLKSGFAEYFRPVEFDETKATFETLRRGDGHRPVSLTHTIEMAKTAGLLKPDSNWVKVPVDMLVARAQSRLARLVYPDIITGLYTVEELEELKQGAAA